MNPPLLMQVACWTLVAMALTYLVVMPAVAYRRARLPFAVALFLSLSECLVLLVAGGMLTIVLWRLVEMAFLIRMLPLAGMLEPLLHRPLNPRGRGPCRSPYAEYREPMPWTRGPASY